jgi:hypothetical protein
MDPRNFLNSSGIFQFMAHSYDKRTQNSKGLQGVLDGTFMGGAFPEESHDTYNKVLMEIAIDDFIYWWYRAEPLYYVLSFGSLILGISGIVMMAVDILKAIDELTVWTLKKDTPVWKQTQIGHQSDK